MSVLNRAAMVVVSSLLAAGAQAGLIDDFEQLSPGPVNGQNGWIADSNWGYVGRDFTRDSNAFLGVRGSNNDVRKALGGLSVADGSTATLFFRFMPTSPSLNQGLGLSDVAASATAPSAWGDFETTALFMRDGQAMKLQGRNGGSYQDLSLNGGANGLRAGTWYDVWMVVRNNSGTGNDTADFYIQGGGIAEQRQVGAGLKFRNSTGGALGTFLTRVNDDTSHFVLLDEIHLTPGVDLARPAAAAAAPALRIDALFDYAGQKLLATDSSMPAGKYPEVAAYATGAWTQRDAGAWTSGFFPGQLWQMYERTGDPQWRARAEARTAGIESQKTNSGTHDIGFTVFSSFGKGYGLTGSESYRQVVLTAADTLSTRYSPTVGAIQSWNDKETGKYEVIIDNMMNLEMLFWASKNGGSQGLYDMAVQHALTTQREHVRADGSSYHVVEFDRATGDVVLKRTHQGLDNESSWSRGQAWGIYGFTMTYRYTQDPQFLATAQAMADFYLDHLPAGRSIPFYDLEDLATANQDTSAAAITASALLELMNYVGEGDRERYFAAAEGMLLELAGPAYLTDGSPYQSILRYGAVKKGADTETGLVYADYYFLEALDRYEAAVPEPGAAGLLALLAAAGLARRRR